MATNHRPTDSISNRIRSVRIYVPFIAIHHHQQQQHGHNTSTSSITRSVNSAADLDGRTQRLAEENVALKSEMGLIRKQMMDLQRKFEKEQSTRDTFETIQFEQKKTIKS